MPSKRTLLLLAIVAVLAITPVASSGGSAWKAFEQRLGLVETQADEAAATDEDLEARVVQLEFKVTVLQSKVSCLQKHVLGKGTCPQTLLRR